MGSVLDVATKSPGVYVFEKPSAVKAIGGVSTSTAGFIGVFPRSTPGPGPSPTPKTITVTGATDTFDLDGYPIEPQESVSVIVTRTLASSEYTVAGSIVTFDAPGAQAQVTIKYTDSADGTQKTFGPRAPTPTQKNFTVEGTPASEPPIEVTITTTKTATLVNDDTNKKGQVKFGEPLPAGSTFTVTYKVQAATPASGSTPTAQEGVPALFTNFTEFKQKFGGFDGTPTAANYLRHAVFGFFNNGGSRCYVILVGTNKNIGDALTAFAAIDEIALVAAPGADATTCKALVEQHCAAKEGIYYRFAILDGPPSCAPTDLTGKLTKTSAQSGQMPDKSDYAAWYFPWITVFDPGVEIEIVDPEDPEKKRKIMKKGGLLEVPPSGHLAGIYARVDSQRGVHKAPANEPIRGAVDVSQRVSKVQQDDLNKEGVNCIRVLNNQVLVWGARTLADANHPELKYINVRRTLLFLRKSIDQGTQWVVFEPNTRALWKKIVRNVDAFLTDVWRSGALFGDTPQEAFYVRCDDEINPPSQRELGLVVTEIGVAIARPAEFVVFQISQFTAPA